MGAIEKIPSPPAPDWRNSPSAIRKAGAPIMVIAVPREAAKDSGINNLEAGMSFSRENFSMGGSINPVTVTWWVNAESRATAGITTAIARVRLRPARRLIQLPNLVESPVWNMAPFSTNTEASRIAGSLLNPDKASSGSSMPVRLSVRMIRMAVKSIRIHSVNNSTTDPAKMSSKTIWLGSIPVNMAIAVSNEPGVTLLQARRISHRYPERVPCAGRGIAALPSRPR